MEKDKKQKREELENKILDLALAAADGNSEARAILELLKEFLNWL
ncbi:hypothetical protein [Streptococcus cuniculi]|nr:hypothetical protein [Streptococcus cuniculi]